MAAPARLGLPAVERLRDLPHGHFRPLDALRGLAVLLVVIRDAGVDDVAWHPGGRLLRVATLMWGNLEAWGWIGLQALLVFAGFHVTKALLESRGEAGAGRRFALRRVLTAVPLYYFTILFVVAIAPRLWHQSEEVMSKMHDQIWYWTFLCNWAQPFGLGIGALSQCWSLAVEEQFCVLWLPMAQWVSPRNLVKVCLALMVITIGVRVALIIPDIPVHSLPIKAYQFTIARIDALACGALLALAMRDERLAPRLARVRELFLPLLILFILGCAAVDYRLRWGGVLTHALGQSALAILFTLLIAFSMADAHGVVLRALYRSRLLIALGELSFAVYLFHLPIKNLTMDAVGAYLAPLDGGAQLGGRIAYTIVITAASMLLAVIAARLIQAPLARYKDRVAPMPHAKVAA